MFYELLYAAGKVSCVLLKVCHFVCSGGIGGGLFTKQFGAYKGSCMHVSSCDNVDDLFCRQGSMRYAIGSVKLNDTCNL